MFRHNEVKAKALTPEFFVDEDNGITPARSAQIVEGLAEEHLNDERKLLSDPRRFGDWRGPARAAVPRVICSCRLIGRRTVGK